MYKTETNLKNNKIICNKEDIFYKLILLYFYTTISLEQLDKKYVDIVDNYFWELI